jgi:alpha-L-rhamnosidase
MKHTGLLVAGALTLLSVWAQAAALVRPTQLRCEYLENPLGLDARQPRLGWVLAAENKNARSLSQSAYQVLVASTPEKLARHEGDLWDSGRVASDQAAQVPFSGLRLAASQRCFWKVKVWDQDAQPSDWSVPASWEMGLLAPVDWQARWIGRNSDTNSQPAPLLRREFSLKGKVKQARAYICGLGYYELRINGRKIGDHLLDPGYTRFDRNDLYVTYDVTAELQPGANAVGVILGNGWYNVHTKAVWNFHEAPWRNSPRLLFQLRVVYTDGRTDFLVSDEGWKTSTGPIVFDSIYGGETYDARLEKPGWDTAGFNDNEWERVCLLGSPRGNLNAQAMPAIKVSQTLKPVKLTEPTPGVYIFDVGQNLAGMAELTLTGPAGTRVQMRYGERLHPDGTLDVADIAQHVKRMDSNQQHQTDTYILKGAGRETWHSRFTYHGFQYVEATGFPGKPSLENLRALFIHSAIPEAGSFECSNPLFNRILRNARWSFLSNLQGVPTDCPHREKNGWTGDAHLAAEQAMYTFQPVTVHAKWVQDLADEQRPSGELPGIVPTSGWGYSWGNGPAWDSAFLLIPYYQYVYYGDTEILRRHYPGFKRYVDFLTTKAKDGIVSHGLNDWAPWKTKTDAPITSTGYYYVDARITALAAAASGRAAEARQYNELAEQIKTAFNRRFFKPETGSYDQGSQTALSCALYQGLAEPPHRRQVLTNLVAAVEKSNNHIDTGILGCKYILNALLEEGRPDVAYRMVAQKDQPSWGWWLEQGATTLWEQWNGSESRNHIMYGDVVAWFYKALAGIRPDVASPGFKHFLIQPHVLGDLTFARADYDSIRGRITSDWKVVKGEFRHTVVIPPNSTATVSLPIAQAELVRENGRPLSSSGGVKVVGSESGRTVLEAGSGTYQFSGPLAR